MSEQPIDLEGFVDGCRGKSFQDFVWHPQGKSQAPDRGLIRSGLESNVPGEARRAAAELANHCLEHPPLLQKDCGQTADEFFQKLRSLRPDVRDDQLLDAFTYSALLLTEKTPIRGANYLPVYLAMLIGGLVLANVTDLTALVVGGWLLAVFGGLSVFGSVGKSR